MIVDEMEEFENDDDDDDEMVKNDFELKRKDFLN